MTNIYDALRFEVSRVAGCGIIDARMVIVGTREKPSFSVWLTASDELWYRIGNAAPYTYPDDAVDALATMARAVMPFVQRREIFLTPNEPMMIGLATPEELRLAGVENDEGTYRVPNAMLHDEEMRERMAHPVYPNQYWAATLNKFEGYDPANPQHPAGLSFMIVPRGVQWPVDFYTAAQRTELGWNWAATLTHGELTTIANQHAHNLHYADPLGA